MATFEQIMQESGYTCQTTFWMDFSIADRFGIDAVKDTFRRAFDEWKSNVVFLTELILVLNHKIWQHYEHNRALAAAYNTLWIQASSYAEHTLKGDDYHYYFQVTD